jgi:hypothetical protein
MVKECRNSHETLFCTLLQAFVLYLGPVLRVYLEDGQQLKNLLYTLCPINAQSYSMP